MNTSLRVIVLIWVGVSSQVTATKPPTAIGANVSQLSTRDIAELERLAGGKPWLLDAPQGEILTPQGQTSRLFVDVYLQPQTATRELRRGTVSSFVNPPAPTVPLGTPKLWLPLSEMRGVTYAQVVVEGRAFDEVRDNKDTNRPFLVFGQFDDTELVSLVRFIRSKPVSPATKFEDHQIPVSGDSPIISITRVTDSSDSTHFAKAGQVVVVLRHQNDFQGQEVALQKKKQAWAVTAVKRWGPQIGVACLPPWAWANLKESAPNGLITVTGGSFFAKNHCDDTPRGPRGPVLSAKGIRLMFVQGDSRQEMGRIDANEKLEFSIALNIPKDAKAGEASH